MNAQKVLIALSLLNTRRLTTTVLMVKTAASEYAQRFALRNQENPLTTKITMVGTMVRSATMFDESRVVHSIV